MDRKTLLAVILSVVVIAASFTIQAVFFPPPEPVSAPVSDDGVQRTQPIDEPVAVERVATAGEIVPVPREGLSTEPRVYRSDLIEVTMVPHGGAVSSYRLLQHLDGDDPVDMVFRGAEDQRAFTLHFGTWQAPAVNDLFWFEQLDANTFEFSRDFHVAGSDETPFTVYKRYRFHPAEYMFTLEVEIRNSVNRVIPLNFPGTVSPIAYTVGFGPQMGPAFERLDRQTEFRHFMTHVNGKRQNQGRVSESNPVLINERISWAAIAGKYFAMVALTDSRELSTVLAQQPREGLPSGAQLYLSKPVVRESTVTDRYQFFVGPKTTAVLDRYNNAADNAWGRVDLKLGDVQETRLLFGWLENILKWLLQLIVRVIPNYGMAIIVLTIIVKLALWPLTRKSYESNARMQAVQPKMADIRERFKNDQTKQNAAMAELYKKEGVNPLGGCLPMLAQFPFFIAMYGLFNNHFDLRGATFIPGWIPDLSAPDVVFDFGGVTIPLIQMTALRGLPIIFLATQLLSTKLTQTPTATQSNAQMKLMQFGLPIVFFFILYNLPSGLLVYWIFSNVLTSGQQYYYNLRKPDVPPPAKRTGGKSPKGPPRRWR